MSAGRRERFSKAFILTALALAVPVVTMSPAGAQCYPPPCGGGGPGGTTTTVVAPTTTTRPTTTTTAPGSTTTTRVAGATTTTAVPIAPRLPEKSVKGPEQPVDGGKSLLSRTGANIVPLVATGLALTLVGVALARVARRRTAPAGDIQD